MKIESLIIAENKNDASFFEAMNLQTDSVIVNQGKSENKKICKTSRGKKVLFIDRPQLSGSASRNAAIINATSEICSLCDDGFIHINGMDKIIEEAYRSYPDADVITFQVTCAKKRIRVYHSQPYKHNIFTVMGCTMPEITFKPEAINRVCLNFNEHFGKYSPFVYGDDTLFLCECLTRGLKMYYIPVVIQDIPVKNYADTRIFNKEFFVSKGAAFYATDNYLAAVYSLFYALARYSSYKDKCSFFKAMRYLKAGRKAYKRYINKER